MNLVLKQTIDRQYEELKIELAICRIGGLFLALYENDRVPQIIIDRLKKDLPTYFQPILWMTEQKIWFPIFFSQAFEQIGEQSNIFHVLGIGKLPEKSVEDFIKYLQYGRERFKAKPYSIVFWVHPSFIKRLFDSAPDFHHWISGIYDFTRTSSLNEEEYSDFIKEIESDSLEKIDSYLRNVIWQYEHWDKVKDSGEKFLIEIMGRANLYEYYVKSYCIDINHNIWFLDELLDKFLVDNEKSFMTLLGDFGTGKSSFSLGYFIIQARRNLLDKSQRIPIFISLKDYPGSIDVERLIIKEFYEKFGISVSFTVFENLALQGKFLFFLDGFDEMTSRSSEEVTIQNFKELAKLSFEERRFLVQASKTKVKPNKVFLTCRTHYFFTEVQEREILKVDYTVLYRNYATKRDYEIARINLKEFNSKQIEEYVFRNTKDEKQTLEVMKIIEDTYNLKELSTRPLLLEMIVKTLPKLKHEKNINASNLYRVYTNNWITQEDWRSKMTPDGKREFMWDLAVKMFKKGGDYRLHYPELDPPNSKYLKGSLTITHHGDYYIYETTACSFLNRDLDGNYKFIHKSFMEYFIAEYYYNKIKTRQDPFIGYEILNEEIRYFLKFIISYENSLLEDGLDLCGSNLSLFDLSRVNLEKIKLFLANLFGANLREANLHAANLKEANLEKADLFGANLREANLHAANLKEANLEKADLFGANLREANLHAANLKEANLVGTYLKGADLTAFNLRLAYFNLSDTDLSGANFTGVDLSGVDLSRANLENANLYGTILRNANLTGANLRGANLTCADLNGANLNKAKDLSEVKLIGVDLSYANLSKVNLSRADLTKTFLWRADLSEADLTEANLTEARLSQVNLKGAYLTRANLTAANITETNLDDAADLTGATLAGCGWPFLF